jgi:predicted CXXCH cytochrome family protein
MKIPGALLRARHVGTISALLGLGLLLPALLLFFGTTAQAAPLPQGDTPSDQTCLACHARPNLVLPLGDGSEQLVTIDYAAFQQASHGSKGIGCANCHADITGYPHPSYDKNSVRELTVSLFKATRSSCQKCHGKEVVAVMDSVHEQTLQAGNDNAAVCADCHNPHYLTSVAEREQVPDVCARCHSDIAAQYKDSVHGAALLGEANPDVPTCIDCHGVHDVNDPRTVQFRNDIPLLCARCHTDAKIMDKYGISTDVLKTYVADFHGTTVTLFEKQTPDQPTNKPVCTDCHGVHSITRPDDPQTGIAIKANLLDRCQRCHPDASSLNFPNAWMSHYIPSPQKYPIVFYVNLFYKFFIPIVIGSMLIFVISDIVRRQIERLKGSAHK